MNIFKSIPAIIEDIQAVKKTKKEGSGIKYAYRGIDDLMNALNPLMAKHKVTIVPNIIDNLREPFTTSNGAHMISVVIKVNYRAYADDGSFIEGSTIGEAFDSGDKASNKAMSVALKYFIMQTFMVPTEDIEDSDNHDTQGLRDSKKPPEKPKQEYSQDAQKGAQYSKETKLVSEAQVNRLWTIQRNSGKSVAEVMTKMKEKFQLTEAIKLNMNQYDMIIKWLETK